MATAALSAWLNKTGRANGTLALATWAEEADCGSISMDGTGGSNFARRRPAKGLKGLEEESEVAEVRRLWGQGTAMIHGIFHGACRVSLPKARKTLGSCTCKDDIRRSEPDMPSAKRHLVPLVTKLSQTRRVATRLPPPCRVEFVVFSGWCVVAPGRWKDFPGQIGGTGLEMYFTTLRTLGILFATMAAITFPTSAFCLLGTFAPDNGQFLARASIGNLGLLADTKVLDPLLRIVRVGCDGAELSDLTPVFAWLDLASMIVLFLYLVRFRFIEIPRRTKSDDLENVSVQDFAVVIDKLPPRKSHLEERMKVVQRGKTGGPEPHVADITLVRDFGGRLENLKERGHMLQGIEVARLSGKTGELPVLRAYVILNRTADKHSLMYDYRAVAAAGGGFIMEESTAEAAVHVAWLSWTASECDDRLVTFIIILSVSLVLIYVITVLGKQEAGAQLSYIGSEMCDPKIPDASANSYVCLVSTASNWTVDYAVSQGGDILNCWCESQGYAKLVQDSSLVSTCTPWFLETARGIGIMSAASCVVVCINLVLQLVLIAMARFERPLSLTSLNQSMMQKIFVAQTLNTGFVLFIVNQYGPEALKKQWQEAIALLTETWRNDADTVTVNCTISACAAASRWQEATALLSEMTQHAAAPDVISYTAVINACERAKLWQHALAALASATAQLKPDACLHNAAIAAMQRSAQWQRALQLLEELCIHKAGLQPDVISFNSTISACSNAARWECGLALLMSMPQHSLRPDAVSTSAALRSLGTARRWADALALLANMLPVLDAPDTILLGSAMNAMSGAMQWQRALVLLNEMRDMQIRPNAITCSTALSACDRGSLWRQGLQLLEEILQRGARHADSITYCSSVSACGKASQWSYALAVFAQSIAQTVTPNNFTYNATISACDRGSCWPAALQLLEEMEDNDVQPDLISFNATMAACCAGQQWHRTLVLFRELGARCLAPDTISYNAVLEAAGDADGEALFLSALPSAYPRLLAKGREYLDLHDLSAGAAKFAVRWWLGHVGYWSGRHPSGLEIITGRGSTRKAWSTSDLKGSVEALLNQLGVRWANMPNPGRIRLLPRKYSAAEKLQLEPASPSEGEGHVLCGLWVDVRKAVEVIPLVGRALFAGPFEELTRAWYIVVGATIMINMLLNMVVPPGVTIANIFVTWLLRKCCRGRVKHHSELIALYTNPEFDIKLKYAQMLTTVFVTLTYSAGMPLLYLFAFGYMTFMYWADKIALLWCSKRPPSYDALLPREVSEKLLYAIALHCIFAIFMYGQPCVFPSNAVGGDLGILATPGGQMASEHLQGWWPTLTRESTWMFVAWFSFMLSLWVAWWLAWAFQGTFGTFGTLLWQLCCASKKVEDEATIAAIQRGESVDSIRQKTGKEVDIAATMTWPEAAEIIDRCSPPSSYHMEDHPDMLEIAHLMKAEYTRGSEVNPEGGELPVPQPAGQSFGKAVECLGQ
ncbi:unnamed protein product [Symbiodinium natans]|uniref:Smr domain-containing protein n=1 Tax=Symbiodinium natans TaxID=878477 RepID=A0A812LGX6_9DINO|nr:unnamed protein product [Symbiodinium natans]